MKICQIIHSLQTGGAELLLLRICSELRRNYPHSYEFTVIATNESGPLHSDFEKAGIKVVSLNLVGKHLIACIWSIFKVLIREKPDIVHTHLLPPDKYGQTAAFLALIGKRVSTIHNMEPSLTPAEKKAIAVVRLFSTRMIAVSQSVKNNVISRYGFDGAKIDVIYTAPSSPPAAALPKALKQPVRIVNLANIKESKGQHFLVKAAIEMKKITARFSIDIVGDAQSAYADKLNKMIIDNGLTDTVFLKGKIDHASSILSNYTIMISLSLWEGFPLALIEGMGAGLPMILSDIPPHRELMGEIDDYTFARPDDPGGITSIFRRLISDGGYYSRLSQKMIERSRDFSITKMIEKYDSFYRSFF
ncbi:MAG: glycosyltransferase [Chitinispirillaceae bacterium]|nr:glycosyltransferase [Chitinispirillaceae bacterium]